MQKQEGMTRTSLSLPNEVLKAMSIIKKHERVAKNSQVELGVRWYLERHKDLLKRNGIDLWKSK